ncbi:hypothetical protein CJ030_MR3G011007 [Morella rubra]|uniref:Uncharacterized protein n=1 Tax=Morella rubra TaxID=262757 RepID=A0A6A1WB04_9ROSI|nr:hypothetical protein CJ030_MR3G011007 [Morella rubra]
MGHINIIQPISIQPTSGFKDSVLPQLSLFSIELGKEKMVRRSQVSLFRACFRHPFQRLIIPSSSSFLHSLATIPAQLVPDSVSSPNTKLPVILNSNVSSLNQFRKYSAESGDSVAEFDQNREVDMINLKFAEAREEIEMAMESKETVYFDEEAECARAAVKEVLDKFEALLAKLPENGKAALQRSMGLKIEQLKAELQQLNE